MIYAQFTLILQRKVNSICSLHIHCNHRCIYSRHNATFQPRGYQNVYQSFGGYRIGLHIQCSILLLWELSSQYKTLPPHGIVSSFLYRPALHTYQRAFLPRIVDLVRHYYSNPLWLPRTWIKA